MSTIDERIVEMTFKSADFVTGVSNAITALTGLKKSLNMKDAANGIDDVEKSASKFSLAGIASSVEGLASKFSALSVIGITALTNIVNKAVDAGLRVSKALVIDPIAEGFNNYESQINSTKTIMANTGASLGDVTNQLNQLNTYANQTIYSFSNMAEAIGQFSAAGVPLKEAVATIKGLGNSAALSGAGVQQLQSASYQMSQALAAGVIKLQDWNSLQNAGIASGKEFQQAFEETSASMGKNVTGLIKEQGGFRNSLQKGWLTAGVFNKTMTVMAGTIDKATGKTVAYSVAQLEAMGYTKQQAVNLNKLSAAAISSATQIRTFSGLMDTLKDEVGTAWATVFKALIGDLPSATYMFTKIHGVLENLFTKPVYDLANFITQLQKLGAISLLGDAVVDVFKALSLVFGTVASAWKEVFPPASAEQVGALIQRIEEFTFSLIPSAATLKKLHAIFLGLFSGIKIVVDVIGSLISGISSVSSSASKGGSGILDLAAKLGNLVTQVKNYLEAGDKIGAAFTAIGKALIAPVQAIGAFFSSFGQAVSAEATIQNILSFIKQLGSALLQSILNGNFTNISTLLNQFLQTGVLLTIQKFIKQLSTSHSASGGLFGAISESFDQLTGTLKTLQTTLKATILEKIAIAVALLAASMVALSMINIKQLGTSLGAMTVMFAELVAAMLIVEKNTSILGSAKLAVTAAAMDLIAAAIDLLVLAIAGLAAIPLADLATGLGALAVLLGELAVAIKVLGTSSVKIAIVAPSLLIIAVAMNIFAAAVAELGSMDISTLAKGVGTIAAILLVISGFNAISGSAVKMAVTSASLVVIATAMNILALAIRQMGNLSWSQIAKGLVTMGGSLVIMLGAMNLMPSGAGMILTAASFAILTGSLVALAGSLKILGGMSWQDIAQALIALAGAITILVIAMGFMETEIPGAEAMVALSYALSLLAPALKILGSMNIEEIAIALIAMAGALAVFGIGAALLEPVIPAMLGVSGALLVFSGSIALAAGSIALLILALTGFAGVLAVNGTIIIANLTSLIALIPLLGAALAKGFTSFITAFAANAPKLEAAVIQMLSSFLAAIVAGTPKIIAAFMVMITDFLNSLDKNAPILVSKFITMLTKVLNAVAAKIPAFGAAAANLIATFLNSIAANIGRIITAGVNIIIAFLNGIANNIPRVANAAANIVISFINAIGAATQRIIRAGVNMIINFINGLARQINADTPRLRRAGINLAEAIINGMTGGLLSSGGSITSTLEGLASNALGAAKHLLGIASPSKRFRDEVGAMMGLGMVVGLNSTGDAITSAAENAGNIAVNAMKNSIMGINEVIDTNLNSSPTISPVVDLTQATLGLNSFNNMTKSQLIAAATSGNIAASISSENATAATAAGIGNSVTFNQYNSSPVALNATDIYRQTKNQISQAKGALSS